MEKITLHDELWAGVDLKLEIAAYDFRKMSDALQLPRDHHSIVLENQGTIVGDWHLPFYASLDGFLAAGRSVPEVIACCFGHDTNSKMAPWWRSLCQDEKDRRDAFTAQFQPHLKTFRDHPLSNERHISEHRTGCPTVTVAVSGMFGVTYIGTPTKPVPLSETRQIDDPEMAALLKARRVWPHWSNFTIDGRGLFEACQEYLKAAQDLVDAARGIAQRVHGNKHLTPPSALPLPGSSP